MPTIFTPHPYQKIIIEHIKQHKRCAIWASMGLGKTVSTLTALEDLYFCGAETKPTLVLAPLRVAATTWPDEAIKWQHLRNIEIQPIVGTKDQRLKALKNTNASVFTTNYDTLQWLIETLGKNFPFGTSLKTRWTNKLLNGANQNAPYKTFY